MAGRYKSDLKWSDVTPKGAYVSRRAVLAGGAAAAASLAVPAAATAGKLTPNTWEEITSYNNYYEFGTRKEDPARYAGQLTTSPWAIVVDGLVERPGTYDLADILKDKSIEERIYRFRCVEGWSRIVPWNGFELKDLLDQVGVEPSAKYVAFETLVRPEEMPGVRSRVLEWPYREGLRLDEAMHPLTLMATGIYGEDIPNQNGAPMRLVVPWKYGFKSIKSIVRVTLTDREPPISWNMTAPNEYGFYSNVNPEVDHPRWSQATERPIGGGLLRGRQATQKFNGYAEEVASMYAGMDLSKFF